jgi:hypothetical protein
MALSAWEVRRCSSRSQGAPDTKDSRAVRELAWTRVLFRQAQESVACRGARLEPACTPRCYARNFHPSR